MIDRTTLAACLGTMALAVPAGWHLLDADIQADGPKIRPPESVLHLDGADVSLQVDRGALISGNTVSAIMVATADQAHAVTVDLTTLEDMGMGEERVSNPPLQVDHRKLTLQAQPGGGPPVVATIKLGSKRESAGDASWYDLYLTPHGEKAPRYSYGYEGAHAGVTTWSKNSFPISIEPPATIPAEGPFTVAVRVKNTTKAGWTYVSGSVGGTISGWSPMDGGYQFASDDYDIEEVADPETADDRETAGPTGENGEPILVMPGAERVMIYRITPKRFGVDHFTIVGYVRANGGGAMDVVSFDRPPVPDAAPGTVATR